MNTSEEGFTLIEMVVVIGIFSVVLLMVTGMVTRFTASQRHAIAEQSLQSDLRFALELFNREIRTGFGSTFEAISGDPNRLVLRNQNNMCVQYRFHNNADGTGAIERAEVNLPGNQSCVNARYTRFFPLTKTKTIIDIEESGFFPYRANAQNNLLVSQGFVMVKIVASTVNNSVPPMNVQSTVTSRQVVPFESVAGENN